MKKVSADRIHTVSQGILTDHVIIFDQQGSILDIDPVENHDLSTVDVKIGDIIPGFVNTHCHLELSHMKGKVDTGTSLLPFLQNVVQFRDISQEEIDQKIEDADQEMWHNGIMAVGDICNKVDTALVKSRSKIDYYSFVEMFDFMQSSMTANTIAQYEQVYKDQSTTGNNKKSKVPHAPYTVSQELLKYIAGANDDSATISIHNQETPEEDLMFRQKRGAFLEFYKNFGFSLEHFEAIGHSSIHYLTKLLNPKNKTLFVHNTCTSEADISHAQSWGNQVYWATCPNANLYIENRLPAYQRFINQSAKMTIGTDSLTSNWQLCILEEIKTILKYQSYLSFEKVLEWATLNGAEALSFQDRLGSIDIGKSPGLLHLSGATMTQNGLDIQAARVERIM